MWLTDNLCGLRATGTNLIQTSRFLRCKPLIQTWLPSHGWTFIFWHETETEEMPKYCSLHMTVLCLLLMFVDQLDPTSQIVICFLFAQPLVCKLLSVNQATNYTAAATEWNHFYLRSSLVFRKNIEEGHSYSFLMYLLWNILNLLPHKTETLANVAKKTILLKL